MCGIFGIALFEQSNLKAFQLKRLLRSLFLYSESRGKESAGLYIAVPEDRQHWIIKTPNSASQLLASEEYQVKIDTFLDGYFSGQSFKLKSGAIFLAHSRLVTNGRAETPENNQPVLRNDTCVIHNGIVVNVDQLWNNYANLGRKAEVDTEIIAALLDYYHTKHAECTPIEATQAVFSQLRGSASIAWTSYSIKSVILASNTSDLFYLHIENVGIVFASEKYILESALKHAGILKNFQSIPVEQIKSGSGLKAKLDGTITTFSLTPSDTLPVYLRNGEQVVSNNSDNLTDIGRPPPKKSPPSTTKNYDNSLLKYNEKAMLEIKRCSRCILPVTFPYIEFDSNGVCNYCKRYKTNYVNIDPQKAVDQFREILSKFSTKNGDANVLVPFSGGRDSCYGLHLIVKEFGLNPITFTYDWGMVTDLARRNIARFCGELGVQNILVSADIKQKRENIRKNVAAWLRKPELGLIPLFMAGDKHFFKILNQIKKQTNINLNIWSANPLENTDFKVGLCGVRPEFDKNRVDYLPFQSKVKLLSYYGVNFIKNPALLNDSLLDTASAFLSYYFTDRGDFFSLFHHLLWEERLVNQTIIDNYGFELAPDSTSTWRIGDGTAPFYNYIYVTSKGFSEFDTFRSNQIREGQISRPEALQHVIQENSPRGQGLAWYLDTINLDFNETIKEINKLDIHGLHG